MPEHIEHTTILMKDVYGQYWSTSKVLKAIWRIYSKDKNGDSIRQCKRSLKNIGFFKINLPTCKNTYPIF
jgi:hypothetical protein